MALDNQPPVKLWYRIGEVAQLVDLDPSVLRHWESEFRALKPRRTNSGQRLYRAVDVERIREIKRLLYEQKYTTKGAIQHLRRLGKEPREDADPVEVENEAYRETLRAIRNDLLTLLDEIEPGKQDR